MEKRTPGSGRHRAAPWPTYNTVWRWHFYAGLFCIPFVLWLSLTGSIYLFKPQVEAWIDRPYARVAVPGVAARSAADQAAAAVAAVPGSALHRYQLPETPEQAVQVIVGRNAEEWRVYVHPQTLAPLKVERERLRPMRVVSALHGTLLAGEPGSWLVELAASWTIVMILTGLFLWWPRGAGAAGVIYPRLGAGGRRFWRDLHGVAGFWVSAGALFLLISGLPWAASWGSYLKVARTAVEGGPVRQDWSIGGTSVPAGAATRAMASDHADHAGMAMAHPARSYQPLDRLAATLRPLNLAAPVLIAPPTGTGQPWTAKSDSANRPLRTDLTLDGDTGRVLSRRDFAQRRLVDRLVGWGVAIHEGRAFGWLNQLLNLLIALGLMLLSASGVVLWWRRRSAGSLGAPPAARAVPTTFRVVLPIMILGLLLPLFGVTLAAVAVVDRVLLSCLPKVRAWMGLRRTFAASPPT